MRGNNLVETYDFTEDITPHILRRECIRNIARFHIFERVIHLRRLAQFLFQEFGRSRARIALIHRFEQFDIGRYAAVAVGILVFGIFRHRIGKRQFTGQNLLFEAVERRKSRFDF